MLEKLTVGTGLSIAVKFIISEETLCVKHLLRRNDFHYFIFSHVYTTIKDSASEWFFSYNYLIILSYTDWNNYIIIYNDEGKNFPDVKADCDIYHHFPKIDPVASLSILHVTAEMVLIKLIPPTQTRHTKSRTTNFLTSWEQETIQELQLYDLQHSSTWDLGHNSTVFELLFKHCLRIGALNMVLQNETLLRNINIIRILLLLLIIYFQYLSWFMQHFGGCKFRCVTTWRVRHKICAFFSSSRY